jgi:hypothetical protein
MTLAMSDEEREVLSHALVHYVEELRREINHTDDHAFKARLQRQAHVLQGLVSHLDDK